MKYLIKIIIALIIFIIVLDRFSLYLNKEKFKKMLREGELDDQEIEIEL